jgi:hypothetical protein
MIDQLNLNSFLHFGYFLDYDNKNYNVDFSKIDKEKYEKAEREELIKLGSEILKNEFNTLFKKGKKNVVPLSGGMDSRAILALLMEHTDASSIYTYTFGTSGTYDYDIGNYLAKKYQTKHTAYNLPKYKYNLEEFKDISSRVDHQSPLLLHPPMRDVDAKFSDGIIWSGANAGAVVGSFYKEDSAKTYREAQERFVKKACFTKSKNILNCDPNDLIALMDDSSFSSDDLTFDEQVFFKERSVKHLAPHVLMKGFTYKLPFVNNEFMNFMLSVPNHYRIQKDLYKEILFYTFPDIFKLPSESTYGLPYDASNFRKKVKRNQIRFRKVIQKKLPFLSVGPSPMVNYMDWNWAFRNKEELKTIIHTQLMRLTERNLLPWIDIMQLWKDFSNKKNNFSDIMMVLFSLEIHLQSIENKER